MNFYKPLRRYAIAGMKHIVSKIDMTATQGDADMPRNRMIRPEFWVSEQLVYCSRDARLLFIGMWNHCDDGGIHPASYPTLKMSVFPGDDCTPEDMKRWVSELIANGLIKEYAVQHKLYWIVEGWKQLQKIEKPTYRYPRPENDLNFFADSTINCQMLDDMSPTPRLLLDEPSIRREEKGREEKEDIVVSDADSPPFPKTQNCPHNEILAIYHETLPLCTQIRKWTKTRQRNLQQRWKEDPEHQSLDFWRKFFVFVGKSKFLTGQVQGRQDRAPFLADLEWLVKPDNFVKVIEGKYHSPEECV